MRTRGDNLLIQIPVIEEMNLLVDGSNTLQHFTPNETFQVIAEAAWVLHFDDNAIDFDAFGAGAALANGTAVFYDDNLVFEDNITTIHSLAHPYNNFQVETDEAAGKGRHITASWDFYNHMDEGLFMPGHNFTVIVQDNITLAARAIDYFEVYLKGYALEQDTAPEERNVDWFRQAFGEKALVFPSPLYAFGLILLFLAAFYALYRKFIK